MAAVWAPAIRHMAVQRTRIVSPPFTASVQPIGQSAALAVIPLGQPILAEPLRQALADVVRESVREELAETTTIDDRCRVQDALTIMAFPFAPSGFTYIIIAAFSDAKDAAVWAIAVLLVVAILLRQPLSDAVRELKTVVLDSDDES